MQEEKSGPIIQGDPIPSSNNGWGNANFRCTRYSPSFSGFIGKDLTPMSPIEINPIPSNCEMILSKPEEFGGNDEKELLYITDILGKRIYVVKKNILLLYVYSNGDVKRKIVLE